MGGGKGGGQTIGYKHYLGLHAVYCHGPIDKFTRLTVDDRKAWEGEATGGQITVSAESLFGGEDREGGVSGTVDIEMGDLAQTKNSYLLSKIGTAIPAYRGVAAMVFRDFYWGNNPYLKPVRARGQRIHTAQDGDAQWYDAKAEVGEAGSDRGPIQSPYPWSDRGTDFFNIGAGQETSGTFNTSAHQSWFNGHIDSVRVTKGVARYTGTSFLPPTAEFPNTGADPYWSNVVTLLKFNGSNGDTFTTDEKGNAVTMNGGAHISTAQSKFGGSSALFDGVNDWVKVVVGSSNQNLGSEYTIEAWVYLNAYETDNAGTGCQVLSAGPLNTAGYDTKFAVTSSGFLRHQQYDAPGSVGGSNPIGYDGTEEHIDLHQWYHVAWCLKDGYYWCYVDGQLATPGITPGLGDMNPAHIIRECLTNQDWGMGYTDDDVDDVSFTAAADTLFDEGMGISLLWEKQTTLESFINEIIRHIDAALFVSRFTGKFVLKLLRDDYDIDTIPAFDESNIDKIANPSKPSFGELVNSVTVQFWNTETGRDDSVTVQDPAGVQQQGTVINTTVQYQGFTRGTTAQKAAARDHRALSNPFLTCTIYTGEDARALEVGDVIKVTWAKWAIYNMPMRITGYAIAEGKSNSVRLTVVEDVFATPATSVVAPPTDGWVDPSQPPSAVEQQAAGELPYYELVQAKGQSTADSQLASNPELGFVVVAAPRTDNAINARMWTDAGGGFASAGVFDFCPSGTLQSAISKTATTATLLATVDLDLVVVGTHFQIGDDEDAEICRIDVIDTETGEIEFGRGVLDTVPAVWPAGTRVYFADAYAGVDPTEYVTGEMVDVRVTPASGQGTVDIADAIESTVMLNGRAWRPYPPGDFRINGLSYTDDNLSGPLTLTWKHRDRLLQTSGTLLDHTAADVGPEAGTTYRLRCFVDGVLVDTVDPETSGSVYNPPGEGLVRLDVDSKRDGVYSWQAAFHEFIYSTTAARADEGGNLRYDEAGDLRVLEN